VASAHSGRAHDLLFLLVNRLPEFAGRIFIRNPFLARESTDSGPICIPYDLMGHQPPGNYVLGSLALRAFGLVLLNRKPFVVALILDEHAAANIGRLGALARIVDEALNHALAAFLVPGEHEHLYDCQDRFGLFGKEIKAGQSPNLTIREILIDRHIKNPAS
jgi:hypothetical protein